MTACPRHRLLWGFPDSQCRACLLAVEKNQREVRALLDGLVRRTLRQPRPEATGDPGPGVRPVP